MNAANTDGITIYTDGGCNPNPGPGGWAVLLILPDGKEQTLSGGEENTTNNRMELTAALRALEAAPADTPLTLFTDSQYLRRGVTQWLDGWQQRGWKKSDGGEVLNRDLWQALAQILQARNVTWHWVKGHANNVYNERVDRLATAAMPRPEQHTEAGAVRVHVRVSCVGNNGGWAARLIDGDEVTELSGHVKPTTANRLELQALVEVIRQASSDHTLEIYAANDYVYKGITQWLSGWKRRNWQTSSGKAVKNADLWRVLDALNRERQINWVWVRDDLPDVFAGLDALAKQARQ